MNALLENELTYDADEYEITADDINREWERIREENLVEARKVLAKEDAAYHLRLAEAALGSRWAESALWMVRDRYDAARAHVERLLAD